MKLTTQKENVAEGFITPKRDAPLEGKMEVKENSWNPSNGAEKSQEEE